MSTNVENININNSKTNENNNNIYNPFAML